MLNDMLKVPIRTLYREKIYALINISGLSLAMACCLILGLYLHSELTYDWHNTRYKQIFRVVNDFITDRNFYNGPTALTSPSLGPMLAAEYSEIQGFVRIHVSEKSRLIRHEEKVFYWNKVCFADENIFDVFTHDIIYGDPKTALVDPTSVAVSESFSQKYFGNSNPIGKIINSNDKTYKITLVFADLPENTHLRYEALISINSEETSGWNNATVRGQYLNSLDVHTFLLMPEGYDTKVFNDISDSFFERHEAEIKDWATDTWKCWLQPLSDIHLQSDMRDDQPTVNKFYLYGFAAVAVFILMVACINYMNLSTARASKRAKEVGIRKILGSGRMRLMLQFLGESIFFSLIALVVGCTLVEVILNLTPINALFDKPLALNLIQEPGLVLWMIVFSLVVGLMSGGYPAIYLSSMPTLTVLMGGHRAGKGSIRFRQLLVLIQFIITVSVIACSLLMAQQMRYVSQKPLGFNKENRIIITLRDADLIDKIPTIKKELSKNSSILGISACSSMIGQPTEKILMLVENKEDVLGGKGLNHILVEDDFLEVMGIQLVEGRDLSRKLLTDLGNTCVVNETMVKKMGNKLGWEDPLRRILPMGRVIGVVKDFHFASLHSPVELVVLSRFSDTQGPSGKANLNQKWFLILHISGEEVSRTLQFIDEKFSEFVPRHPFEYKFLDDAMDELYLSEQRLMKLTGIFSGACIFISCLGLFGLAAFTTELRTKEIGIRKVLGASTWQIITMLYRNILFLVFGGSVFASLVAYYTIDKWLDDFAYRTSIDPWVFLLSTAVVSGVTFVTVALQSFKTAQANPVNALRYE